jgi:hypothetical protein
MKDKKEQGKKSSHRALSALFAIRLADTLSPSPEPVLGRCGVGWLCIRKVPVIPIPSEDKKRLVVRFELSWAPRHKTMPACQGKVCTILPSLPVSMLCASPLGDVIKRGQMMIAALMDD